MTQVMVFLSAVANGCGKVLLAPIGILPGWLSATLVGVLTGVFMLAVFKYTSNQRAIERVRNRIKANLLALSLFKDSVAVGLRCQLRILAGASQLLLLAVVPMLVMTIPMCLLLAQLALWYQARPLRVGEEAILTVVLSEAGAEVPEIELEETPAAIVAAGPVRVACEGMICWKLRAAATGHHRLAFHGAQVQASKDLEVGDGLCRVSLRRPTTQWLDAITHPAEQPFPTDSPIRSIEIDYPKRDGLTCGSGWWLVYWFAVSMLAAFCARPWLNVKI